MLRRSIAALLFVCALAACGANSSSSETTQAGASTQPAAPGAAVLVTTDCGATVVTAKTPVDAGETAMEFERDFGGAKQIALEQNYRSTNAILRAANAVISENRERKPKNLWSELGEGDPVRVIEVEDEHAEARFVAAEIAGLVDEGFAGSEIAVFYRTNAQSRVVEDVLVRQDIPYQVIGGPKFYERAEIKDAIAYLQVVDNPSDAISLARIANRPRRGIGDASLARLQTYADAHGLSLWEALEHPEEAGCGGAPLKAIDKFRTLMQSSMAGAEELPVPELLERILEQSGYLEALEAERTIEAQGRIENLQELVGVAREYQEGSENPSLSEFLQQISLFSDQDAIEEERSLVTLMRVPLPAASRTGKRRARGGRMRSRR